MKRNIKIILIIIITIVLIIISLYLYNYYRVKNAKIEVELVDNLEIEVYSDIKLKNLIKKINGKLIKNKKINTKKLGLKKVSFKYINEENIKVSYTFDIDIVDKTPPIISNIKEITLYKNSQADLKSRFFCGDNYDNTPSSEIIGDYNLNEVGNYNLIYKASDSSGNESVNNFILHVIEKQTNNTKSQTTITHFSEIKEKYKTEKTKIGIDISHHQGSIDYEKVKEAGVEFVFIRIGSQKGKNGELYLDSKFKDNIEGFNKTKIPVGLYFFSYASNKKEAKKQADWIIKHAKNYKIDLPIAFDWENWTNYQDYNLSFYNLTDMANTFTSRIEKLGYKSMLYSSKNYLEKIWINPKTDIWLAHYTNQTNYKGKYKLWQMCDDGIIDGIDDNKVDIDIMY